jgi:hypothetical protein
MLGPQSGLETYVNFELLQNDWALTMPDTNDLVKESLVR